MDEQQRSHHSEMGFRNPRLSQLPKVDFALEPASGMAKVTVKQCASRLLDHRGKLIAGLNLGKLREIQTVATSARSTRTCQGEEVIGCQPQNTLNGKG
jgi:hypothetical protein